MPYTEEGRWPLCPASLGYTGQGAVQLATTRLCHWLLLCMHTGTTAPLVRV